LLREEGDTDKLCMNIPSPQGAQPTRGTYPQGVQPTRGTYPQGDKPKRQNPIREPNLPNGAEPTGKLL